MSAYALTPFAAPAAEPLSLSEAKKVCDIDDDVTIHDDELTLLTCAARQLAEARAGRQLVTATWDLLLRRFPAGGEPIEIPLPPLQSITSITYLDAAGDSQTLASSVYRVSTAREPGRVSLAYGQTWPVVRDVSEAVTVRFVAGYGGAASVPHLLKQALRLQVRWWFTNPDESQTELLPAVGAILDQYHPGDEFTVYEPSED